MASTACAPVINGVVRLSLMAPPAATASEMAVILSLFGTSMMTTKSKSPKQYHAPTSFPPTASHAWRQRSRYDSEASSPEQPKIETYKPLDTCRVACWTSLIILKGTWPGNRSTPSAMSKYFDHRLVPRRNSRTRLREWVLRVRSVASRLLR